LFNLLFFKVVCDIPAGESNEKNLWFRNIP
jgi:hypothetical protein